MIESMKKTKAGFTLVELIVVIAILGILAGIAVPVYSGYIAKASEAADMQLLGAMNTAFSAACASRSKNPTKIEAGVVWTDDRVTGVTPAELDDDFRLFWGDNAAKSFKTFSSIGYEKEQGVFVGDGGVIYMGYLRADGQTVTIAMNADDVNAFKESTFAGENLTAAELMEEVQKVADRAALNLMSTIGGNDIIDMIDSRTQTLTYINPETGEELTAAEYALLNSRLRSEYALEHSRDDYEVSTDSSEFDSFMKTKLGNDWRTKMADPSYNGTSLENYVNEYKQKLYVADRDAWLSTQISQYQASYSDGEFTAYLKSLGMKQEQIDAMTQTQKANALVLLAADGAEGLSADTVLTSIDPSTGSMTLTIDGNQSKTVTQTTIPYALVMAYANSEYANDQIVGYKKAVDEVITGKANSNVSRLFDVKDNPQQLAALVEELYPDYAGITPTLTKTGMGNTARYTATFYQEANPGTDAKEYFDTNSASMSSYTDANNMIKEIMQTEGFQTYYNSNQAKTDLEGFLGAMNMISDNAANVGWEELLNQGYNSDTLKGIVSTLVGETYTPGG